MAGRAPACQTSHPRIAWSEQLCIEIHSLPCARCARTLPGRALVLWLNPRPVTFGCAPVSMTSSFIPVAPSLRAISRTSAFRASCQSGSCGQSCAVQRWLEVLLAAMLGWPVRQAGWLCRVGTLWALMAGWAANASKASVLCRETLSGYDSSSRQRCRSRRAAGLVYMPCCQGGGLYLRWRDRLCTRISIAARQAHVGTAVCSQARDKSLRHPTMLGMAAGGGQAAERPRGPQGVHTRGNRLCTAPLETRWTSRGHSGTSKP